MSTPPKLDFGLTDLVKTLYAIIDSKIKFMEYEMNKTIKAYAQCTDKENQFTEKLDSLEAITHKEKMMQGIEQYSYRVSLLLLIRKHLSEDNSPSVLQLVNDDLYLTYDRCTIIQELKIEGETEAPNGVEPNSMQDNLSNPSGANTL